jgi:hypothetical protein
MIIIVLQPSPLAMADAVGLAVSGKARSQAWNSGIQQFIKVLSRLIEKKRWFCILI